MFRGLGRSRLRRDRRCGWRVARGRNLLEALQHDVAAQAIPTGLRMRLAALLIMSLSSPQWLLAQAADTSGFRVLLNVAVTDTLPRHEVVVSRRLRLVLHRQSQANGTVMGWSVAVYRQPASDTSRNLLYHSLNWHGPYPTDVLAWIHAEAFFPDDRLLPVYGEPWELRLVCRACQTAGDSTFTHFTAGSVVVSIRRAKAEPLVSPKRRTKASSRADARFGLSGTT